MPDCSVVRMPWGELTTTELYSLLKLRTDVFFLEQKIDEEELDWRDAEPTTEHWWIAGDAPTETASYLRTIVDALPSHRDARRLISRVVTHPDQRGRGLSRALLQAVVDAYGQEPMMLHAQVDVAALYARFGFEEFGDIYTEAGLPHILMYRAPSATHRVVSEG
ncbi:MAG: GNAT family N-acetyltransferase [Microbacteriaceae bacterium]